MSTGSTVTVKGGKTENEFENKTITLRGVEYTVRELDVVEYKACLKAATNEETGLTPFQDLLDQMVLRAVDPSPAKRTKPMPYPVYRTLEDLVNTMHFITLRDEKAKEDEKNGTEDSEAEGESPNS